MYWFVYVCCMFVVCMLFMYWYGRSTSLLFCNEFDAFNNVIVRIIFFSSKFYSDWEYSWNDTHALADCDLHILVGPKRKQDLNLNIKIYFTYILHPNTVRDPGYGFIAAIVLRKWESERCWNYTQMTTFNTGQIRFQTRLGLNWFFCFFTRCYKQYINGKMWPKTNLSKKIICWHEL